MPLSWSLIWLALGMALFGLMALHINAHAHEMTVSYIITCKLSRHSDYSTQVVLDVKILVDWTPGHEDGLSVSSHWDVYTWGLNRDFMLCWCIVDLIISLMHCWLDSCTCILVHSTSNLFWLEGVGSYGLILAYTVWNLFKLVWLLVLSWVMVQRCVVDSFTYALLVHLHRGSYTWMLVLCQAYFSFDVLYVCSIALALYLWVHCMVDDQFQIALIHS